MSRALFAVYDDNTNSKRGGAHNGALLLMPHLHLPLPDAS